MRKISDEPLVTSECWTYYKMSVIQTGRGLTIETQNVERRSP